MKVAYTGVANFRRLSKKDLAKAGVEDAEAVTFTKGEAMEVPDEVGEVLISKEGLLGDEPFKAIDVPKEEADTEEEMEDLADEEAEKAAKKEGKSRAKSPRTGADATTSAGGAGDTTATGRGTSTGRGSSTT